MEIEYKCIHCGKELDQILCLNYNGMIRDLKSWLAYRVLEHSNKCYCQTKDCKHINAKPSFPYGDRFCEDCGRSVH